VPGGARRESCGEPGHTLHAVTIGLYDHPKMLNDAVANGLTDDQWGMVKERDYPVGPWYLSSRRSSTSNSPGGVTGTGFVLWNLLVALILIFALPLIPGIRSLPRKRACTGASPATPPQVSRCRRTPTTGWTRC
jgi:hypothetical protein